MAWIGFQIDSFDEINWSELLLCPVGAITPIRELAEWNERMSISSYCKDIPVDENTNSSTAYISSDNAVSKQDPSANQIVILLSWRVLHDVYIWWIETKGSSWWSISDEVHPEQLD